MLGAPLHRLGKPSLLGNHGGPRAPHTPAAEALARQPPTCGAQECRKPCRQTSSPPTPSLCMVSGSVDSPTGPHSLLTANQCMLCSTQALKPVKWLAPCANNGCQRAAAGSCQAGAAAARHAPAPRSEGHKQHRTCEGRKQHRTYARTKWLCCCGYATALLLAMKQCHQPAQWRSQLHRPPTSSDTKHKRAPERLPAPSPCEAGLRPRRAGARACWALGIPGYAAPHHTPRLCRRGSTGQAGQPRSRTSPSQPA